MREFFFDLAAAVIVTATMLLTPGCGMSRLETAHAVQAESDTYIANQIAIAQECSTIAECTPLYEAERARYRAARAAVCRAGKGCR